MGKKNKAPKPPDYSDLAEASLESAKIWEQIARDQLDWAKTESEWGKGVLEQVLGVQLPQMEEAFRQAQADRQRYEQVFQPIEEDLVREFREYDTQERREQEASERMADVRTAYEAQRRNATQQLEDYGIDPSQTRFQALDLGMRAQEAANVALAANQGRESVEQMGRALRGEAINIGRGLPSQIAQTQGIVNQTAGGAMGNVAGQQGTAAGLYGTAVPYAGLSQGGIGQAGNLRNMGYQNQLDQWGANQAQSSGFWGGLGGLAGAAIGGPFGGALGNSLFGGAEGGEVPDDLAPSPQPGDTVPTALAEGEYVIPEDVVRRKGTEFFDKLKDKYSDGGEYEQKREEQRQALPLQLQYGGMVKSYG